MSATRIALRSAGTSSRQGLPSSSNVLPAVTRHSGSVAAPFSSSTLSSASTASSSKSAAIPTSKPAHSASQRNSNEYQPHTSQLSPRAPPKRQEPYSPVTVAVVKTLAKMMGYNTRESTAIRVTSDLYDACTDAVELNADFWYEECGLPRTYQTWFQLTNLHVWLLLVRFRAFPTRAQSQVYAQEIINHFFIDAESRMRERFGVQTARLVKGYMRDMHQQQRGAVLSLDEALGRNSDAFMAAALWRNIWGGGWGVVGGVKRKLRGIDRSDKPGNPKEFTPEEEEGAPDLAVDKTAPPLPASITKQSALTAGLEERLAHVPEPTNRASSLIPTSYGDLDALIFAQHLASSVDFVRAQVDKLAHLPDDAILHGEGTKASQLFTKAQ
ncbi:Serine carboxypeptidase 3 [Tilletia horrida]|uniref:Serine carboxypeptidase 3 n=1 Tax=Tilletia horrida TaxID=155126 RepID=A0AAN6GUH3_9BASI|nr:Serine carboxypeptidase 3 [Tilletia horrida]